MKKTQQMMIILLCIISLALPSCTEKAPQISDNIESDAADTEEVFKIPVFLMDPGIVLDIGYNDSDYCFVKFDNDRIYRRFDEIADNIEIGQSLKKGDIVGYWYGTEDDLPTEDDVSGENPDLDLPYNDSERPYNGSDVGGDRIFELRDGTKITMIADYVTSGGYGDDYNYIIFNNQACTIELVNGIIIDAPINTRVDMQDSLKITIGDDNAAMIQPDGTATAISAGTVLDGEGNIIK